MGKIIEGLKQNTPEWLDWRKGKIGASEAPIIVGVSKWCTPWQLYMRKLGLIPEQSDNEAMARGREKEDEALAAFNVEYGCNCVPVVMVHDEYPWMIASLDGWDAEKRIAVEVKCPGKEDHEETAVFGEVPEHYYPQIMHQLEVANIQSINYFSWKDNSGACSRKFRDAEYIKDMIAKELDFIRRLKELDPPELTDRDYVENYTREWRYSVSHYNACKLEKDHAEKAYEEARSELIRLSGDRNCKGSGLRLTKSVRKGLVEYGRIPELKDVDLEKYRKEPITTWRISEE